MSSAEATSSNFVTLRREGFRDCKARESYAISFQKSTPSRFMAGYSGTPLVRKLGIAPNETIVALNAPDHYRDLLDDLPEGATITDRVPARPKFVHLFETSRSALEMRLQSLRGKLDDVGMLWVSWPKKAAKVPSDITEDVIRAVALPLGYVDVKVCAVDQIWSGLKLVIRRENRGK